MNYLHEKLDRLRKRRDRLLRLLHRPQVFHTLRSIPVLLPNQTWKQIGCRSQWYVSVCHTPAPFVVLFNAEENAVIHFSPSTRVRQQDLHGSWNMTTTSSRETWTSAHKCYGLQHSLTTLRRNTALNALCAVADGLFEARQGVLGERSGCLRVSTCQWLRDMVQTMATNPAVAPALR